MNLHLHRWAIVTALLLILAAFFRFALKGYAFTAYTICFIAALVVMHHFFSPKLWRIVVVLVSIGLLYFIISRAGIFPWRPGKERLAPFQLRGQHPEQDLIYILRGTLS